MGSEVAIWVISVLFIFAPVFTVTVLQGVGFGTRWVVTFSMVISPLHVIEAPPIFHFERWAQEALGLLPRMYLSLLSPRIALFPFGSGLLVHLASHLAEIGHHRLPSTTLKCLKETLNFRMPSYHVLSDKNPRNT